jgi:hypothetical protein
MRFLAILLLLPQALFGATAFDIQTRVSFETGDHWDFVSAVNLLTVTEGPLITSYSFNPASATNNLRYSTNGQGIYNYPRPYSLPSVITNFVETAGTRSLAVVIPVATSESRVQLNLVTNCNTLVGGYYYRNEYTNKDSVFFDFFKLHNGAADTVIQFVSGSASLRYQAHTGSPSAVGSAVNVTNQHTNTYTCFKFNLPATNFTFSVWDTTTRNFLGEAQIALSGGSYPAVADIRIGNDSHSSAGVQRTNYMDNLWLSANLAHYPAVPWDTNQFYISQATGNNNNSGKSPTQPWLTMAKAAATLTAGQYVTVLDGIFAESWTMSTDGTSTRPIKFVAASTNVILQNCTITGDYIWLCGFYFTKVGTATNSTPVVVSGTTGVRILENYFVSTGHGTSGGEGGGIRLGNNTNLIVRGNEFNGAGTNNTAGSATNAKDIADANSSPDGLNVLIEYNRHMHSAEYMNVAGKNSIFRNIVFGPTGSTDWGGTPHIDGLQANQVVSVYHFENNWQANNTTTDAHMLLVQYSFSSFGALIGNVSLQNGDAQSIWIGLDNGVAPLTTNHYIAHNLIANSRWFEGSPNSAGPVFFNTSTGNWAYGNVYSNVTTSATPYQLGAGGVITDRTNDFMYPQGSTTSQLTIADPQWENYATGDLRPKTTSPLKDAMRGMTVTTDSGTGTTITVLDTYWFHDGYGLTRGSAVFVGNDNNLYVTGVNRAASTITLNTSITWVSGESVGRAYKGSGSDVGPYEFGDTLLTTATMQTDGAPFPTYTVTTDGETRFVEFFANGVSVSIDYDSPYTYTATGDETVTAIARALRPQATMSFRPGDGGIGGGGDTNTFSTFQGNAVNVTVPLGF